MALGDHHSATGRTEALNNNWETLVRRARGYRDHAYLLLKLRFMTANPRPNSDRHGAIPRPVNTGSPACCRMKTLARVSPKSRYLVGPSAFPFLWIAANELPLRDDVVPFLVARSGRALIEFVRWVSTRRPPEWVTRRIQILPMPAMTREEALRYFPRTDDPELQARQRNLVKVLLDVHPELNQEVRGEGRIEEARRALRRVLTRRGLGVSVEDDARIEACSDLETLERWLDEAIVAASSAEALR